MKIFIETMDGVLPEYAHYNDAGMDVRANETVSIYPGETKVIKTGIKMAIPDGIVLDVRPRSGLSLKTSIRIANSPGTIDAGYRGEIGIIVHNIDSPVKVDGGRIVINDDPIIINNGDKIAQFVFMNYVKVEFEKIDDVTKIDGNRNGGFGSTGI